MCSAELQCYIIFTNILGDNDYILTICISGKCVVRASICKCYLRLCNLLLIWIFLHNHYTFSRVSGRNFSGTHDMVMHHYPINYVQVGDINISFNLHPFLGGPYQNRDKIKTWSSCWIITSQKIPFALGFINKCSIYQVCYSIKKEK